MGITKWIICVSVSLQEEGNNQHNYIRRCTCTTYMYMEVKNF